MIDVCILGFDINCAAHALSRPSQLYCLGIPLYFFLTLWRCNSDGQLFDAVCLETTLMILSITIP